MKKEQVPQDSGILDRWHRLNYAVDQDGTYQTVPSSGSEPVNVANRLAWDLIRRNVERVRREITEGRLSPLAYHMARHQMTVSLLAQYTGFPKRRVKRHLKPSGYEKLTASERTRYAEVFEVPEERLNSLE